MRRPAEAMQSGDDAVYFLDVQYSVGMQPLVKLSVGGQWLNLVFDASSGNTQIFVKEKDACVPKDLTPCYSYEAAKKNGYVRICKANDDDRIICGASGEYKCDDFIASLDDVKQAHEDQLVIDGIRYDQAGVEGLDSVQIDLGQDRRLSWSTMPVRLLVKAMSEHPGKPLENGPLPLFEQTDGILGASGPSLGCRNETLWGNVLHNASATMFVLDLQPPPQARIRDDQSVPSRVVLNHLDPRHRSGIVWSQPKQTGDVVNDGMHEFLVYRPHVCGVDLLYNVSSNWLAVIDTSGPCLSAPPFLFDAIMTHIPVLCPFRIGEPSLGRLCSPDRQRSAKTGLSSNVTLPTLWFQLQDDDDPAPKKVPLPLERLVFTNPHRGSGSPGEELLCVARSDSDVSSQTADMMFSHIAFGSLVVSALYTVINLENATIGLSAKSDPPSESTSDFCAVPVTCTSTMQTYYPPRNICEDPDCGEYIFMILDKETKMCRWGSAVPAGFVALLLTLAFLDLASHRLYKQAIEKASEFCQ